MQEDAAALQEMAKAWTDATPPARDSDTVGEDRRWRVLTIAGHGVDVLARHEAGMQQLADLQSDPGMTQAQPIALLFLLKTVEAALPSSWFLNRPCKCRFHCGSKRGLPSAIFATICLSHSEQIARIVERCDHKRS
jgi:hypothetical protein